MQLLPGSPAKTQPPAVQAAAIAGSEPLQSGKLLVKLKAATNAMTGLKVRLMQALATPAPSGAASDFRAQHLEGRAEQLQRKIEGYEHMQVHETWAPGEPRPSPLSAAERLRQDGDWSKEIHANLAAYLALVKAKK